MKRITTNESPLVALLDQLIQLSESDYKRISEASLAGRKLRFDLEAIKATLS
jgi:hypothetical protein